MLSRLNVIGRYLVGSFLACVVLISLPLIPIPMLTYFMYNSALVHRTGLYK
jgi:hypothetical protein